MPHFIDGPIRWDFTLASRIELPQPQPTFDGQRLRVETPNSVFTATVTATPLTPGTSVNGVWRAGFIQEIIYSSRSGDYTGDLRLQDRLWGVAHRADLPTRPIRDSRGGELPYDGHSDDLTDGVPTQIESEDDPNVELPLTVRYKGTVHSLTAITGADQFTIWLAATKDAAPKRIVILARMLWRVEWRAVVDATHRTAAIPMPTLVTHSPPEFGIATAFGSSPLPPGYPQDLSTTEANELAYRITSLHGFEVCRTEIDADPTEPSSAIATFNRLRFGADSWW